MHLCNQHSHSCLYVCMFILLVTITHCFIVYFICFFIHVSLLMINCSFLFTVLYDFPSMIGCDFSTFCYRIVSGSYLQIVVLSIIMHILITNIVTFFPSTILCSISSIYCSTSSFKLLRSSIILSTLFSLILLLPCHLLYFIFIWFILLSYL